MQRLPSPESCRECILPCPGLHARPNILGGPGPALASRMQALTAAAPLLTLLDLLGVALQCHPNHHGMTWEDVVHKFHRAHSPIIQDIAPSFVVGRPLSPAPTMTSVQSMSAHEPQQMDIDSSDATHHQVGRPPLSEARLRTPLPSGPRLDKALSLPGIESLKNGLQNSSSPRFLSTGSCSRYIAVDALLLYWLDDDDPRLVEGAAQELASVFASYYHYSFKIRTIPSSSEANKSSWRWLARQLTDFAEERDQRDVLKIVYYAGHTYRDFNGEMILARYVNKGVSGRLLAAWRVGLRQEKKGQKRPKSDQ